MASPPAWHVPVLNDRIGGRHLIGDLAANHDRNLVDVGQRRRHVVGLQQLVAFAQRVPVVRALANDVDRLPRAQAHRVRDQRACRGSAGSRPSSADADCGGLRPDLLPRAGLGDEWIVVRYAVAAVLADVLVAMCSDISGTMRRILPTSVSRRCGFGLHRRGVSPEPPSPQPIYITPHSASPARGRVEAISPIG